VGKTRQAVGWATLPLVLSALYLGALLRLPLPSLYGTFWLASLGVFVGCRAAAMLHVLQAASPHLRRPRALHVVFFLLAATAYGIIGSRVMRSRVGEAFRIPGGAMQPTLLIGDYIMVDKAAFRGTLPARGTLVVFESPEKMGFDYVERAVALPGDELEVVNGHLWLNGWEVPHCILGAAALRDRPEVRGQLELEYLGAATFLVFVEDTSARGREGPYVVKEDEIWALGDNRTNSFDSRYWFDGEGGGVPVDNLKGHPAFAWLAFNRLGYPEWSRMGASLSDPRLPQELAHLEPALRTCLGNRPKRTEPPSRRSPFAAR
jgi:signal peptidase I